jgi:hypothetical protein
MFRRTLMNKILDAALAVSFLAFVPGCDNKPREVSYADLGWEQEKYMLEGKTFSGVAHDTHKKNGKPRSRWEIKNGVPHGVVKEWHESGQLIVETHYHRGLRHGMNRYWRPTGELMKEQVYEHGKSMSVMEYPAKP